MDCLKAWHVDVFGTNGLWTFVKRQHCAKICDIIWAVLKSGRFFANGSICWNRCWRPPHQSPSSSSSPGECKRLLNPLNSTRNSCLFIKRSLSGLKGRGIRKFISHIQLSHNLLQLDLWLKNPTLTSNIYLNQLSKRFNFKMFNWGGLMSYSQFYLVNLKQLLKVRKATTSGLNPEPAWKCRFIPPGFAFKEEQFKDYSKVEIVTKTKLHFSIFRGKATTTWIISTKKGSNFSKLCSLASGTKAVCVSCEISAAMLFSNLHRNAD